MKKIAFTLLSLCFIAVLSAQEPSRFTDDNNDGRPHDPRSDQFNFVPNEVLIKFKDDVTINNGTQLKSAGINNIDQVLKNYSAASLEKLFPSETKLKSTQIVKDPTGRDMVIPNLSNIYKIVLPQQKSTNSQSVDIFQFIEEMKALPEVEYAEPNYIYTIGDFTPAGPEMNMLEAMEQPANDELSSEASGLIPNDPLYNQQWGIPATNIDDVWNSTTGDSTSIIAILDTGVDWLHPDLAANIWRNSGEIPGNGKDDDKNGYIDDVRGWDFINNDNDPKDDNSHGTHVAGIAAAVGNNGIGIAGANWKAKIMPIKVIQSSGRGDAATIAKGITYAANKGANVINMSFGSTVLSLAMRDALANAYATAVLVAASGNDACCINCSLCGGPRFPAAFSFVLGVEANSKIRRAPFSNYDNDGPAFSQFSELYNYELKAPGVDILSCVPGGNYREYNGTSMAAPLVSGAVSLYKKQKPNESQEMLFGNFINSQGLHIDLEKALIVIPEPKLQIVTYELIDTIDGDRDGRADAGETIEIKVQIRNTWGQANDVKVEIDFGTEYEDRTTATILADEATVGSVSAYATKYNEIPLKIKIGKDVSDGRDIVFKLKTWYGNHYGETSQQIVLNIENGIEIGGTISGDLILTPNKQYIVTGNMVILENANLIIRPGTILKFKDNISLTVAGKMVAEGKVDSLIVFTKTDLGKSWNGINFVWSSKKNSTFTYCVFENMNKEGSVNGDYKNITGGYYFYTEIENSIFRNNWAWYGVDGCKITSSCFYDNNVYNGLVKSHTETHKSNFINNVYNQYTHEYGGVLVFSTQNSTLSVINFGNNNLFNNIHQSSGSEQLLSTRNGGFATFTLDPLFYGTTNDELINKRIYDFTDLGSGVLFNISNKTSKPEKNAHGIVWKIHVNDVDAQDEFEQLDPIGVGQHRFDIYFNRPMDIEYPPMVSMGVRYPYTQTSIAENGAWSDDSTIYTIYGTVGLTTGDGINTIRVTGAKDTDHFEIPIEDRRFKVIVDAAGSASTEFMATAGLGKVNLEWRSSGLSDELGFNMYRMEQLDDSTLSNPVIVNETLITDTLYTDPDVTPNQKYFYYYKVLRSNLAETDSSKTVAAIPFTAQRGDANGDLSVSVLDITTIVDKILNNAPNPFYEEAADANSDGELNVLDIIATINLILNGGQKSSPIEQDGTISLFIQNDTLFADATTSIAAFQFDFYGINKESDIERLSAVKTFEFASKSNDNTLRVIGYSLTGSLIEKGDRIPLLKLNKGVGLTNYIVGDINGNSLAVNYNATALWNFHKDLKIGVAELGQNYPNPLNGHTTIPVFINEPIDKFLVRIIDVQGKQIAVLNCNKPVIGENILNWNSGQQKGLMAYILEVYRDGKQAVCGVKKMIAK